MSRGLSFMVTLCFGLIFSGLVQAQDSSFLRTNPKFLSAFREVVAQAGKSTVRVLCDGKDTALGMVVGADGWILTKANDLKGNMTCRLRDGRLLEARLVGEHKQHDLAMLRIAAKDLTPVNLTDSTTTPVGNWVACPGLEENPVTFGVVSVASRSVPNQGMALNVPPPGAGYLGVATGPVDGGVRIVQVMPRTAAEKAGLKANDIVLNLAGKAVTDQENFIGLMHKFRVGDVINLRVKRGDKELEFKAQLGKRPPNRGEIQNHMGSTLSSRRSGYPIILQFDGVIKPADCGGPLVNLEGKVIGISICRAGRTENWAIPAEVIRPLLADLKAGKYALPTAPKQPPAKGKSPPPAPKKELPPEKQTRAHRNPGTLALDDLALLMHGHFRQNLLCWHEARS